MSFTVPLERLQLISDQVMGGVSHGTLARDLVNGQDAVRMRGRVSLENNGGFIQMAADINADGTPLDGTGFTGLALTVLGNGETYNVHLRTSAVTRPWQSYRQSFIAGPEWETHSIPFSDFAPHRIEQQLDTSQLTRIGIVAIGRAFEADVSVAAINLV